VREREPVAAGQPERGSGKSLVLHPQLRGLVEHVLLAGRPTGRSYRLEDGPPPVVSVVSVADLGDHDSGH
jgi:hypothetical protein